MAYATVDRGVSGVNLNPEQSDIVSANNYYDKCLSNCTEEGGLLVFCADGCLRLTKSKAKINVATYHICKDACEEDGGSSWECHSICCCVKGYKH